MMRRTCVLAAVLLQFAIAQEKPAATADPIRTTIDAAIDWIAHQAVPVEGHEHAIRFPTTAEQPKEVSDIVYGGSAGVLVFLENAAKVLDHARARELADETAAGLLASARHDDKGITWAADPREQGSAALYLGDAGIGAAFLVRARLRHDDAALKVAREVGDGLLARGKHKDGELSWDRQVEVIYGASGTALFLLELADASGDAKYRDAAHAVGRFLIGESDLIDKTPKQRHWSWDLAGGATYTGFSHGTAGVAYTLLRIGKACDDDACVQAAKDGAEWLASLAVTKDDLVSWPAAPNTKVALGGWCHGPPGTARLFLLLHEVTGEQRWLDLVRASSRWVMAQAGPEDKEITPSFPPSFCCGVGGVIDWFCDLSRVTGEKEYAAFARRAAQYLVTTAQHDDHGAKWANGSNAHQSDRSQHGVDLMLGASGEAFALLRVLTLDAKSDPVVGLPDRAVVLRKG
ncbi:MAG: lanthionine synthetase LanC family protein [Planctomycetota bacterium]